MPADATTRTTVASDAVADPLLTVSSNVRSNGAERGAMNEGKFEVLSLSVTGGPESWTQR